MRHNFKTVVDSLTVPTFVIDIEHKVIAWNKACELLTGITAREIIGTRDAWKGFYSSARPCLANIILNNKEQAKDHYLVSGQSKFSQGLHAENWFEKMNGKRRYLTFDAEPIYDEVDNTLIGALENLQDITDIKQVELRQCTQNQVMTQLMNGNPLNDIFESLIKRIELEDPFSRCSILLLDRSEQYLVTASAPSLPKSYTASIDKLQIQSNEPQAIFSEIRNIAVDITTDSKWLKYKEIASFAKIGSCWSEPLFGRDNKFLGLFIIYHAEAQIPTDEDIQSLEFSAKLTSLIIEQNLLREQHQLSTRVFSSTLEGITITNAKGVVVDANPAFTTITGYDPEDVMGDTYSALSASRHTPEVYKKMWGSLHQKGYWQGELWNRKKTGETYAEFLSITSLKNAHNDIINYVGIFADITETKQQQEKLNLMAHYDELTGLPNRVLFNDRFKQAISHSKRTGTQLAIIFLDLDKFKPVNDSFGHNIGDKLLVEVAKRIKATIRDEDTVSRQGGDEFALLLGDINSTAECHSLAKRIHTNLSTPFHIENHTIEISASSGITLYPAEDVGIDTLMRYADQAMYQAKLAGRNRYIIANHSSDQQNNLKHNKQQEIVQALVNNEFALYYQPKVDMTTGTVYGVEALIRWIHPQRGLIPPLQFLPLIDSNDLDIRIGNWVINEALQQLEKWTQQGIELEVSINISSHHILSDSFYQKLDATLALYPTINSQKVQLEILESSALSDINTISRIIESCQDNLGIKVALDDFGTGYSSLTHLKNLSADTIKIDRSFVRNILGDPGNSAIIDGIIGLANAFNRQVIAEGVESTEHGIALILMGCISAQGYGIAKPMPAKDIYDWLNAYQSNEQWILCGQRHQTEKDKKIKLFQLVTNHWKDQFVININVGLNNALDWPISNQKHCHCGIWIKRALQDMQFDEHILNKLVQAHESTHKLASDIRISYQSGNSAPAHTLLPELITAFDDMNTILTC